MKRLLLIAVAAAFPLAAVGQTAAPDLIVHHGKIFTAAPEHRWAEAVAIKGNRIVAVGTNAEIAALAGDATRRVDAGERVVVPGFNDAHTHQGPQPQGFGLALENDPSWSLVNAALVNGAEETAGDFWIFGTIGPKLLADPAVTAQMLDKATGGRKVMLSSWTGHGQIFSTAAMDALRIRDTAPDPPGGWYERDAKQHLTGKMFEYAGWNAQRRMAETVPDDEAIEQLKNVSDQDLGWGITSIQNMSMLPIARFEKIERHAPAPIRIRIIRFPMTEDGRVTEGRNLPVNDRERPLSTISGTKWILDGTPVERGAAVRRAYPGGSDEMGKLDFPPDEITAIVKEAFASNEQTLLHVAGDRTAAVVLDAMRAVGPAAEWRKKRLRFEHGDGLQPDLITIAKDLGIVVVLNPAHVVALGLYPPAGYMPYKSLLKAGVPIAIGSDGPANPGLNIMLATLLPGNAAEALTREEAVEAYTRGSAYAEMMETEKGSLAPGKLADLAILSQDIFRIPPDKLPETTSVMTIVDGKIVFDAGALKREGFPIARPSKE